MKHKEKLTKEKFIEISNNKFAHRYIYDKTKFVDEITDVCVTCPSHGYFYVNPRRHMNGKGCPKCANAVYSLNHKCSQEDFIKKSREIFGDKFDYSKVEYVNSTSDITLICPVHGVFVITPQRHLDVVGGCPMCSKQTRKKRQPMSTEEYKERVRQIHGDKYCLDKTVYVSMKHNVKAECAEHGEFEINAYSFTHGHGCPRCGIMTRGNRKRKINPSRTKWTTERFIEESRAVHCDKYDYSKVVLNGMAKKVTIICPEHGEFEQVARSHINGFGCRYCGKEKSANAAKMSTEQFIEKSRKIHDNKYDYSKVEYRGCYDKVTIICPIHGEFQQQASVHLLGHGCPKCAIMKNSENTTLTTDEFIEKARKIHKDTHFDYSNVKYVNAHTEVLIKCPKGHTFYQTPNKHLNGHGCSICINNISKSELEIVKFLEEELEEDVITNNRRILGDGKELDIYVPSKKIGIEFNGIFWHTENKGRNSEYHLNKTLSGIEKDIRIIHIFEDEWLNKKEIVKSRLRQIFGKTKNRIYARKCTIEEIDSNLAKIFLNENHIQGSVPSLFRLGLFYKDELVSLMTFGTPRINLNSRKKSIGEFELLRFCNKINTTVVGGASKLFKHFVSEYNPSLITSYADRRWSVGELYERIGFAFSHETKPSYYYVVDNIRHSRFAYRKDILVAQGFDDSKTEKEIMQERGIPRIYDCGCLCYKWFK